MVKLRCTTNLFVPLDMPGCIGMGSTIWASGFNGHWRRTVPPVCGPPGKRQVRLTKDRKGSREIRGGSGSRPLYVEEPESRGDASEATTQDTMGSASERVAILRHVVLVVILVVLLVQCVELVT